ncbi:integral membrane protein DUF92 [Astrocystis sublimbata]|nr:integral membrane protein DUF92 [Astrocystis sublimbata]
MQLAIAIPATAALVYRAYVRKSLTPFGIFMAGLTALAHAIHPWNLPFVLLIVFFLAGTRATAVKKEVKASLTLDAQGSSGGEGPRTHVQVLANSLMGSILTLLHAYQLRQRRDTIGSGRAPEGTYCYSWAGDVLVVGIICNYAAVAADTFSSELGILSRTEPRLITSLNLRKVPRGTNGGVTVWGLVAGFLGSLIIVTTSLLFLPMCGEHTSDQVGGGRPWTMSERSIFAFGLTIWGTLGSLLDSFLGGWLQRSVRDVKTGKIIEGEGGVRVLTSADAKAGLVSGKESEAVADKARAKNNNPTRIVETGWDLLDNNGVNFLMAFTMSVGGMAVASWYWGIPIASVWQG